MTKKSERLLYIAAMDLTPLEYLGRYIKNINRPKGCGIYADNKREGSMDIQIIKKFLG